MSEFNEFDQQGSVPNRETGSIISHALKCIKDFWLWIVAMIIYMLEVSYPIGYQG
jgi:hypothetical protein